MIKCGLIVNGEDESPCGKDICCYECESFNDCMLYEKCQFGNFRNCPNALRIEGELEVIEKAVPNVVQAIANLTVQAKEIEEKVSTMKKKLLEAMETHGVKKFENDLVSFTYVAPTTRATLDKTKLAKAHPEINLGDFEKISNVGASVRIKVK